MSNKKTIIRHLNDKFKFGKFCNRTLGEIMMFSPSYLEWVVFNVNKEICIIEDSAIEEINIFFPDFRISDSFEFHRKNLNIENYNYFNDDSNYNPDIYEEPETYNFFVGSYAQDEMGYSDNEIDTIFDGDPLAYWNID